jgi:2-octaprenyl-6-methoxyphenol hydroxylase
MTGQADIQTDIIIIGGGLIGPALALALAKPGFRVTVLDRVAAERRAEPDFDGRAYAVALGSMRLLQALGVWDAVEDKAQPICDIHVAEGVPEDLPQAAPLLHFDPRELDEGKVGWIVEDRWLRGALLDAMDSVDGIVQLAPVEVAGVDYGSAAATVRLADGQSLTAPLVIACDGRRSAVAEAAGIRRLRWGYDQTGLVNAIEHELPHDGLAHQSFFPGGPFAVLPLPDEGQGHRSSLVWSERTAEAERLQALDDDAFTAEISARIGPRLGRIKLVGRRWAYPLDLTLAERYAAPRLALAGDAAHGIHPIAGQGLNIGLRDVAALAEVLVEAARIGEDIGAFNVLERYQRWRRFDATSLALGMDALNRLFSNRNPALKQARDTGLAAVNRLGGLRRAFMREAAGVAGDVPRLLRGQAL